ncbi:MAG: hypothetical protein H7338_23240, partial [Candidatus Sericytochromatia bacterium]|nr:hypothetical protein [Candidatus Sericytochromatia bacterium]
MSDSWQQLLAYRTRARAWVDRQVGLADTRLRVARLLDVGFDYSWDEVEADFEILGHRADFLVRLADAPWGIVMVQTMGTGLCATPPPEAFVMADGAGVSWCWLTDGLVIQLYHVGVDLVLSRIMHCDLLADDEADLRAFWRLLCREGVSSGRLEQHRQDRERPDHEAVRLALLTPEVLTALQTELARDFRRPGETSDLAGMVAWLCRVPPTPPIPGGDGDRGAAAACSDPAGAHLHEPSLMLAIGPNGCLAAPEDAVHGEAADDGLTWQTPSGQVDPPHLLGDDTGESLEMAHDTPLPVSPAKRRRRGGWRLLEADEMTAEEGVAMSDIPESVLVADTDFPAPAASDATELAVSEPGHMPDR